MTPDELKALARETRFAIACYFLSPVSMKDHEYVEVEILAAFEKVMEAQREEDALMAHNWKRLKVCGEIAAAIRRGKT